jgi:sulfate adenylyltransferase
MSENLISPHGGTLLNLIVTGDEAEDLKSASRDWPSWDLSPRQICDLELLLNGAFSPLAGFMGREDVESVCNATRLADGTLWSIPITLDVSAEVGAQLKPGSELVLRDPEGVMLAVLEVEDVWTADKNLEAEGIYGTANEEHAGVNYLMSQAHAVYVGGKVRGMQLPMHYDSIALRLTPEDTRRDFSRLGWRKIVAFQTRNPMHRVHYELTMRAIREHQANLLIHPAVGLTKPGDVDHYTRVRCYQAVRFHYPQHTAYLALLPLSMRMAGPREALWHAIIRKNFGCTHFIVGRDHAGPGSDSSGMPFYGPYDAQKIIVDHEEELGVTMVPFRMLQYVEDKDAYMTEDEVPEGARTLNISGTELRSRLQEGRELPRWFTFREVAQELRRTYPPRYRQGFTVFFTGLSGSGKSTIANAFLAKLLEMGGRPVTLLDGDVVRKNLSSELGFSKEHRELNILRIGFVANEITKNGGIAVCAPIAPYDKTRREVRQTIQARGGFILVHVSTPLDVCEERDRKGLYAKARAGIIKEFTGISDPYEEPEDAEIVIDTREFAPDEAAQKILLYLEREGFIGGEPV